MCLNYLDFVSTVVENVVLLRSDLCLWLDFDDHWILKK